MTKAEFRAALAAGSVRLIGGERFANNVREPINGMLTYEQSVLVEREDGLGDVQTAVYYTLDEAADGDAAVTLPKRWPKSYVASEPETPAPNLLERAKAALDATLGVDTWIYIRKESGEEGTVAKVRTKAGNALGLPAGTVLAATLAADGSPIVVESEV